MTDRAQEGNKRARISINTHRATRSFQPFRLREKRLHLDVLLGLTRSISSHSQSYINTIDEQYGEAEEAEE